MSGFAEYPKLTGMVTFKHFDASGNLINEKTVKNLVVTTGLQYMAQRMVGNTASPSQMSHMALGSSATPADVSDTALGAQLGRVALTGNQGSWANATVTYSATFIAGEATGAVVEAGIFNASTGGQMLCRTTFPVINKESSDSLSVTWVITVS